MKGAAVAVLACLTAGCATQGYDRAGKTVQSLQATKAELIGAAQQVAGAINTLKARAQAATLRARIGEVIGELDRVSAALAPQAL